MSEVNREVEAKLRVLDVLAADGRAIRVLYVPAGVVGEGVARAYHSFELVEWYNLVELFDQDGAGHREFGRHLATLRLSRMFEADTDGRGLRATINGPDIDARTVRLISVWLQHLITGSWH